MTQPVILPPGPSFPKLVNAVLVGFGGTAFLAWCSRRFGEPFTIRLPANRTLVMFSDPQAVRDIFTLDPDDAHAGSANVILEPFLGTNSLLLLDGGRHLRERRMMLPSFHGERMQAYRELMREVTRKNMAAWPVDTPFPIRQHTQAITFEVIMGAVFGLEDDAESGAVRAAMRQLLGLSSAPQLLLPMFRRSLGPWSPWARFLKARRGIDAAILGAIRRRRHDPGIATRSDILSMLIQARYEDGSGLNDQELRDELVTLLLAGHETTATGLAWTVDLLLHHPKVLEQVMDSLAADDETYLDAVIKESLRLRPVVPQVGRRLTRPATIGGVDLPAGVIVVPNIAMVHARPDIYPDPDAFRPERFVGKAADIYTWIPFGGGTRRCIGAAFATVEMRVVLRTMLTGTRLTAANPEMERAARRIVTLSPRHGTMVVNQVPEPALASRSA